MLLLKPYIMAQEQLSVRSFFQFCTYSYLLLVILEPKPDFF